MPPLAADERYTRHGPAYHRFRMAGDLPGRLIPLLQERIGLGGIDVVELGAGTGPLTLALVPHVRYDTAFDRVFYRNDLDLRPFVDDTGPVEMVFGEEQMAQIRESGWILPQCEGLWWRTTPPGTATPVRRPR